MKLLTGRQQERVPAARRAAEKPFMERNEVRESSRPNTHAALAHFLEHEKIGFLSVLSRRINIRVERVTQLWRGRREPQPCLGHPSCFRGPRTAPANKIGTAAAAAAI